MEFISNIMVVIMRGLSGSGKTTFITKLADLLYNKYGWDSFIVSADNYFIKEGKYNFDPFKLSDAHANCFRQFLKDLSNAEMSVKKNPDINGFIIFVDNTNTQVWEYSPYYLAAQSQGIRPTIIQMQTGIGHCILENTHGVDELGILAQHKRFEKPMRHHDSSIATRDSNIEDWAKMLIKDASQI